MIIKKDELKAKTDEYIQGMIARTEDYVADEIVKASALQLCKVHIQRPEDIPWWALREVGRRYQNEGYITESTMYSLWIVLDDEAYEERKKRDSERDWGWDL